MAKISIDEGELLMAFDSGDGTDHWYLDRETGEVIWLSEDDPNEEEEEIRRAIEEDENDRYLRVTSLDSHEGYRIMEDFASSLEDGRVREALFRALDRHRPFRSFKDALPGFPGVREAWFRYHEGRMREHALDWLRAEGIDAELTKPSPPG